MSEDGIFKYATFNLNALLSLATRLRAQPCTCDKSQKPKTGSLNWVIFITFEDGVEWVFRSPRSGSDMIMTTESASKMVNSEASTLNFLKTHGIVPIPDVYSFSDLYDNDIGVPYILMSKARGRPLSDYDWVELRRRLPGYSTRRPPLLPLTDEHREKIMGQLGALASSLFEIRFDKIGSIFEESDGEYIIGECLNPSLIWQWRDTLEGIDRGPFHGENQYFHCLISAFIAHAIELELDPHVFFAPIPDSREYSHWTSYRASVEMWRAFCGINNDVQDMPNRLTFCVAGQFLREMVPCLTTTSQSYVLFHPDLHLGNVFVDENLNITCVIDWVSASSGPISELLATPGFGGSNWPPSESLVAAFRNGFHKSRVHQEPPVELDQWQKADRIWHFSRLVRLLSTQDYMRFKALYELVYETGSENIPRLLRERSTQEDGRALLAKLREYEDDEVEGADGAKDLGGDAKDKTSHIAVARKLTIMSKMNPNFVADGRLWRWVVAALDQDMP